MENAKKKKIEKQKKNESGQMSWIVIYKREKQNTGNLTYCFLPFYQVIAMIKGLYGQIVRLEPMFSEVIKHNVHTEVQQFIQVNLREPLRKAVKSKKATLLKT